MTEITPRRRMLRRAALALVGSLALLSLGISALLTSQPGLRLVWSFVSPRLPSALSVDAVRGRLIGPLYIDGLAYSTDRVTLGVDSLAIDWDLPGLRRRILEIHTLEATDVEVTLLADTGEVAADPTDPELASFSLPLEVRIDRGVARPVALHGVPAAVPLQRIDSLVLSDAAYRSEATIGSLYIGGPDEYLALSGRVATQGRYPLAVEASGLLNPPEPYPAVAFGAGVSGDLDAVDVDATVLRPAEVRAVGRLSDLLGTLLFDARVTVAETEFAAILPDAPEGRAGAELEVGGRIDSLTVTGTARAVTPTSGAVDVELAVERHPDRVLIERLLAMLGTTLVEANGTLLTDPNARSAEGEVRWTEARWPLLGPPTVRSGSGRATVSGSGEEYRIQTDAEVELVDGPFEVRAVSFDGTVRTGADGPDVNGDLGWLDARWPRGEDTRLLSRSGTASLVGTTDAYRVRAEADIEAAGDPPSLGALTLEGTGNTESFDVASLRVDALDGTLDADGRIVWAPGIEWRLTFEGEALRLGLLLADSTLHDARISMGGTTVGTFAPDLLVTSLTVDTLTGTVRQEGIGATALVQLRLPLAADRARLEAADVTLERLDLDWRGTQLTAAGIVSDTVDVSLALRLPDLSLIRPDARGAAALDLRAVGPRAQPRGELSLTAHDLAFGDDDFAPPLVDSITLTVSGTPASHESSARLVRGEGVLDLRLAGAYADTAWAGTVEVLQIEDPSVGLWGLRAPTPLQLARDSASIGELCLVEEPASACVSGQWVVDGTTTAHVELTEVTGRRLSEMLPRNWSTSGRLGARADASIEADGTLLADGIVDLGSGTLQLGTAADARLLTYQDAALVGTVDERGANFSVETELVDERGARVMSVASEVSLPQYRNVRDTLASQPVGGFVRVEVSDASPFEAALPEVHPVGGRANVDLTLRGTVSELALEGEAGIQEGALDIPILGLELRDIEFTAEGQGAQGLDVTGSVRSDTGVLTVSGRAPSVPSASDPARLEVVGTRFRALGLPEASAWVTPSLEVTAWPEGIDVTGEVSVPVARIELTEVPTSAVRSSRDVVFLDDTTEVASGVRRALSYSLRLVLGDSITFRGLGLYGEPEGSVLASNGPGGTIAVTGDISLAEGRYSAYGQELTMERGRLLFAGGPPDNPGLDIRASRTTSDGTVAGLEVRGTLEEPDVRIFSQPTMMESRALSYLVLGRPPEDADGNQLGEAATALGLQRGNQLASRLGRSLGLDEMTVEAGSSLDQAALVAGTHISSKLYVSYGVGLFEPISTFRIRYMLSHRWTLRAQTGEADSADLLFRIERGR